MKSWFKKNPEFYRHEREQVGEIFPTLAFRIENGVVLLEGTLPVEIEHEGITISDAFEVRLEFPNDYPKNPPRVYEVGGRKEKISAEKKLPLVDLHFNSDGTACLTINLKKYLPANDTTINFIKVPIIYFFAGLSHFELSGNWLFGEFPHDEKGILKFYQEALQINTLDEIIAIVGNLAQTDSYTPLRLKKMMKSVPAEADEYLTGLSEQDFKSHLFALEKLKKDQQKMIKDSIKTAIKF